MLTENKVVDFMRDDLALDVSDVKSDTLLFSTGILDSFSLVSMMTFIESECGFRISPADVTLENMDSVERILAFVQRRNAA
jgi:acyl carrier protein